MTLVILGPFPSDRLHQNYDVHNDMQLHINVTSSYSIYHFRFRILFCVFSLGW